MALLKHFLIGLFIIFLIYSTHGMNTRVSYFEHLAYDVRKLQQQHLRSRRSLSQSSAAPPVTLQFESHGRNFDIRLVPDNTVFHSDLVIEGPGGGQLDPSIAHVYHGSLYGKKGSHVHGSIIDGIFRGVIDDPARGKYYVEENTFFFGGSRGQSPVAGYRGHSVMYHESTVKFPSKYGSHRRCGSSSNDVMSRMLKYQNSSVEQQMGTGRPRLRKKREVSTDKTTCLMFIQTDHVLYDEYRSTEVIISKIAEHVKAVNLIYSKTEFATEAGVPIRNINFKVGRVRVNDSSSANDDQNPFRSRNIGVERFLDIASLANHDSFCLAYVFTNRDFDDGVLGLAWVASPSGSSGGICERHKVYSDGTAKSLNTGIITFTNYGTIQPARVTHITFAHELGHNFGSAHDSGVDCTPGESGRSQDGNFIMYARATTGNRPNNNEFSTCSKNSMSRVLENKKDDCFIQSDQPICGNQIVDEGEQCDCGFEDDCRKMGDTCCTPADSKYGDRACKLLAGADCSITQGGCCFSNCTRKPDTFVCSEKTECQLAQTCNSSYETAACPEPKRAPDGSTMCRNNTQTCSEGECSGSLCQAHTSLEDCECKVPEGSTERVILCHTCCQLKGDPDSCKSTGDAAYADMFNNTVIYLHPGSACDDFNGYCDIFSNCRFVDADGPLSRLKQAIFNPELYSAIRRWIIDYWWAVALMVLALILLMAGFIKVCSVHTPSSNPHMPKHRQLPGANTLRRRSRATHQQQANRSQYEMARR